MSTIAALIGPIEWWWDTPEEPNRFESDRARAYRSWRGLVNDRLVEAGWLVYRPHEAFKGTWDNRAQKANDAQIEVADIVICLRPPGIPGKGTDAELHLAAKLGKPVVFLPPGATWTVEDLLRVKAATLPPTLPGGQGSWMLDEFTRAELQPGEARPVVTRPATYQERMQRVRTVTPER